MPGALSTYGYINAKIRARISLLLDDDQFRRFENASSFEGLLSLLSESDYSEPGEIYAKSGDPDLCELAIYEREYRVYEEVLRQIDDPPRVLVVALARRFEVENVKAAVRIWFEKHVRNVSNDEKLDHLPAKPWPGGIHGKQFTATDSLETLLEHVRTVITSKHESQSDLPDAQAVLERGTVFFLENALDRYFYSTLYRAVTVQKKADRDAAERLIGLQVDVENIRTLARIDSYYDLDKADLAATYIDIPAGKISPRKMGDESLESIIANRFPDLPSLSSGSQSVLSKVDFIETVLEEELIRQVHKTLAGNPFTVGIILSYFILKNLESRKIMSVLNEKRYSQIRREPVR